MAVTTFQRELVGHGYWVDIVDFSRGGVKIYTQILKSIWEEYKKRERAVLLVQKQFTYRSTKLV